MSFTIKGVNVESIIRKSFEKPDAAPKIKAQEWDFEKPTPRQLIPEGYRQGETKCWWHHDPFDWDPVVCPLNKKTLPDGGEIIEGEGFFCGLRCAKAYAIEHSTQPLYKDSLALISNLSIIIRKTSEVDPSPHWKELISHGGTKTLDSDERCCPSVNYVVLAQVFTPREEKKENSERPVTKRVAKKPEKRAPLNIG